MALLLVATIVSTQACIIGFNPEYGAVETCATRLYVANNDLDALAHWDFSRPDQEFQDAWGQYATDAQLAADLGCFAS
jgi:hypothetical protein